MLSNILNKPYKYSDTDDNKMVNEMNIYPVIIEDYSKFQTLSRLLYASKSNFGENNYELLDLIIFFLIDTELTDEQNAIAQNERIKELEELFSLIVRKEFHFFEANKYYAFIAEDKDTKIKTTIHRKNYDEIRKIIMNQNLMFEPKVYKNKITQEWAEMTLKAKMKNQPKIGIEEMLTTVSVKANKHYWDLNKYSIYQIYSDFYRIRKDKNFDTGYMANCQGAGITVEDFADYLDLYKNPYDSVFVDDGKLDSMKGVCK